ncbi:Tm-1-like ATP-binding domain-containing protein [Anaerotruncus colihominis]|uniref:Tm-1-like ATP-binding domain-containing protein n=1 Tax=Anaerotruncus colihominis TaxID=169435 RepID=UPI0018AA34BB|nr:Tm-1-like ATP-binding domain-containing protein [Anaerotruncus colihominis]
MQPVSKTIFLCCTMDTKSREGFYLKEQLESYGHKVHIIDMGLKKSNSSGVYLTQAQVAGPYYKQVVSCNVRSEASSYMVRGLKAVIRQLYADGQLDGIVAIGGSGGTTMASAAMHELPLGVPKVVVTTMASGNTLPYVQGEDLLLINPVVDIQNLNFLTEYILRQAAAILNGMLCCKPLERKDKKAIAITSFGVTTPCVDRCTELLQKEGYEVLLFHARGTSGGKIMEKMIREGHFCAVLDITTSELADEVAGGIYAVGPQRLRGAPEMGIPYVVVPGALEMVNLGSEETLQPAQKARTLYYHSPSSVKMRADSAEMKELGDIFMERLQNSRRGMTKVIIPARGFSSVDMPGKVFYDPAANQVFINEVKYKMPDNVPVMVQDAHVNDQAFADVLVRELLRMIPKTQF